MNQPVKVKYLEYLSIRADLRESSRAILGRAFKWFTDLFGNVDIKAVYHFKNQHYVTSYFTGC